MFPQLSHTIFHTPDAGVGISHVLSSNDVPTRPAWI